MRRSGSCGARCREVRPLDRVAFARAFPAGIVGSRVVTNLAWRCLVCEGRRDGVGSTFRRAAAARSERGDAHDDTLRDATPGVMDATRNRAQRRCASMPPHDMRRGSVAERAILEALDERSTCECDGALGRVVRGSGRPCSAANEAHGSRTAPRSTWRTQASLLPTATAMPGGGASTRRHAIGVAASARSCVLLPGGRKPTAASHPLRTVPAEFPRIRLEPPTSLLPSRITSIEAPALPQHRVPQRDRPTRRSRDDMAVIQHADGHGSPTRPTRAVLGAE